MVLASSCESTLFFVYVARFVRSICLRQRYVCGAPGVYILFIPILWSWFSRSSSVEQPQQQAMEQVGCSLLRSITLAEKTAATRYMIKLYLQGGCVRSYKVCTLYTTRSIRCVYYYCRSGQSLPCCSLGVTM